MVQLIVKPIKLDEVGSYRERKAFLRLLKELNDLKDTQDAVAVLNVLDRADTLLVGRLKTDDGSPVEDALDQLSANQFDQLLSAVAFEGGVGEESKPSSTAGQGASPEPNTPTG